VERGRPELARAIGSALRSPGYWLRFAAIAGAYVAAAKFGIGLSVAHGVITPVWAPSGIALASLLLFGRRLWPAVALGACIANATSGAEPLLAAAIAVGNTLEAVVGATLLRRVGFRIMLERVRDVLSLVFLGAGVATLISATNGVTAVSIAGTGTGSYGEQWLLWWFGDAVGVLMVAPLILVAYAYRRRRPSAPRLLEAVVLAAAIVTVSAVVFRAGAWRYPYVLFPLLLWAALRFRQPGAAGSSFVVGAMATWGTVEGTLPITSASPTGQVQIVQALVGVVAISLLVLGATLAEREATSAELRQVAARLGEAQALTHIGSWEWDIPADRVTWSDELYRIYGVPPRTPVTYASFLERVHPDDRSFVDGVVRGAVTDHQPFRFEHRLTLPDRGTRLIDARGQVVLGESGEPVRMLGTGQDITEQRKAEELREGILSTVSHELRTPLTAILGFATVLRERREEMDEAATRRALAHIVQQGRRLERLLADLLDLDRLRQGAIIARRQRIIVGQLVEEVAARYHSPEHVVTVTTEGVIADVDAPKVERIVENLVANALKHTPPGTPVSVRVEQHEADLLIVVDDEGPGVPDEMKESVFEIFDRGTKLTSPEVGAGLGLSLVARFAELHGGRAWVEDRAGRGASFRVLLPNCVIEETVRLDSSGTA
jgi:signal transduction histidine kinase